MSPSSRAATDRYSVRPVRAEDIEAIHEIERECFSDPWSRRALEEEMALAGSHFVVAAASSAAGEAGVVGYAIARMAFDEAEVANLAVAPASRGQGIGAMLVQGLLDRARAMGALDCWLEVRASNAAARGLYRQLGFDDVGLRRRYYARPEEDAILMRRNLRGP